MSGKCDFSTNPSYITLLPVNNKKIQQTYIKPIADNNKIMKIK